jgi:FkbM family methyltransferase
MYPPLIEGTRRLLEHADADITFVDVGARNGVIELRAFPDRVDAYGFEPNPDEFAKLESGATDAAVIGVHPPAYRSLRHFPYAIADVDGRAPLYVCKAAAASGLLEPDLERLSEIIWKGRRFETNFADAFFEVDHVVDVEVRTLETFARDAGLDHIDYLKVDVEGSEYEALAGAGALLDHVGVIRVEVCFIPFRKKQKLFSEVDILLRAHGFDLLTYEIDPIQIGYKERETPSVFGPNAGYADRYGQPLSGDAVYVNRRVSDPVRATAQAAVLIDKNFLDEALFVLRHKTAADDAEFLELLRSYRHLMPYHRALLVAVKLRNFIYASKTPLASLRNLRGWRRLNRR